MSLAVAWRAFWSALTCQEVSNRIERVLVGELFDDYDRSSSDKESVADEHTVPERRSALTGRSEAVELIATLQRDARFVDFVKENLADCDDATVGGVARRVQERVAESLERWFAIRPLAGACEGDLVELDLENAKNTARVRTSGELSNGDGLVHGRLEHCGWIATKNNPPIWSGEEEDALILAPMELSLE